VFGILSLAWFPSNGYGTTRNPVGSPDSFGC